MAETPETPEIPETPEKTVTIELTELELDVLGLTMTLGGGIAVSNKKLIAQVLPTIRDFIRRVGTEAIEDMLESIADRCNKAGTAAGWYLSHEELKEKPDATL